MAQISLRIDEDVKKETESVLEEIGLSMSAAITIFLKKVARERKIPFELSAESDAFYSENNIKYLEKIVSDIKQGKAKFVEHDLIEVDE